MNNLHKVLVVDDGDRSEERTLSAELAECGFSSVTISVDAAEDILGLIASPSAIFLQMPGGSQSGKRAEFTALADRLRAGADTASIPLFMVDQRVMAGPGGVSALLSREFGPQILAAQES